METSMSPVPKKVELVQETMDFSEAIAQILIGRKITKQEWQDNNIYCYLSEKGILTLHWEKKDNPYKDHEWILSEGDLRGNDYVIC